MKNRSSIIEKKLLQNLEFLKMSSLEMTQMIQKKKNDQTDSENSTMFENC